MMADLHAGVAAGDVCESDVDGAAGGTHHSRPSGDTGPTLRLIDLMCERHRRLVLDTRLWPAGYIPGNHRPGNNSCDDCAVVGALMPSGRMGPNLPGVDIVEEASVHEAGHAVAYLAHGVLVEFAALEPGDAPGSTGHVSLDLPGRWYSTTPHLIGLWAGQAASLWWLESMRGLDDAAKIDLVATSVSDTAMLFEHAPRHQDIAVARGRADDLVRRHWSSIERVADALLARGRLTGDEIAVLAGMTCPAEV